jgi:signal transduction histidine kinase
VELSVADHPQNKGGNGIPNMQRRAESVGGAIQLLSKPGEGCTVLVRIPHD